MAACGGGSDDATSRPEGSILSSDTRNPYPLTLDLENLLLAQVGSPPGFELVGSGRVDNRSAARAFNDPDAWLDLFDKAGRSDGYSVQYADDVAEDDVEYAVTLFRDADGADRSFRAMTQEVRLNFTRESEALGFKISSDEELSGNSLADATFRYRLRLVDEDSGTTADIVVLVLRDINLITSIWWSSTDSNVLVRDVDIIGEKIVARAAVTSESEAQDRLEATIAAAVAATNSARPTPTPESTPWPTPVFDPTAKPESSSSLRPPTGSLDTTKTYHAVFDLSKGEQFEVLLYDDLVPTIVENFVNLSRAGYYDGVTFHRVIADFMAQGGDPTGTGAGDPGYKFADEFHVEARHDKPGILSMANSGFNSNGSQFFITFVPTPFLDAFDENDQPKNCAGFSVSCHAVFGEVVEGMEVVNNIRIRDPGTDPLPGDAIKTIRIVES